jgi:hypothetical protein
MFGACSMYGRDEKYIQRFGRKTWSEERMILKWIIRK